MSHGFPIAPDGSNSADAECWQAFATLRQAHHILLEWMSNSPLAQPPVDVGLAYAADSADDIYARMSKTVSRLEVYPCNLVHVLMLG